ncbi:MULTISPECIES: DUF1697 domain-containing protein [Actinosynnema]|uniref:DUF1697 domain-containing protein n=1 Tax=Actinosynnema TaxID=40566 RepID=UPI0020A3B0AF|nr:DUF1697 domain-containing protein [Actinosynnema pretiosum]MCP2096537.1 Uncharacterized conserved protein, DUF1697 family [Actinosynnema pretiosum]
MSARVLLLRGINVGGKNKVPMADLRALLADLGHTAVSTHLNSGNAVFTPASTTASNETLTTEVEQSIKDRLGLDIGCVVVTHDDLTALITANPLPEAEQDPSRFLVTFLSGPVDPDLFAAIDPTTHLPDRFAAGERVIYQWSPEGVRNSKLTHTYLAKKLNLRVATARNWNTVLALRDKSA